MKNIQSILLIWILLNSCRKVHLKPSRDTNDSEYDYLIHSRSARSPPSGFEGYIPNSLWCLQCRSDDDPECINNGEEHEDHFTTKCTEENFNEFAQGLIDAPPESPIVDPRSGSRTEKEIVWACYRVHTIDGALTFRTCVHTHAILKKEECIQCKFKDTPAKCCTCGDINCNIANTAIRLHSQFTRTFKIVPVAFGFLLLML